MNEPGYKRGRQPTQKPKVIERIWYTKLINWEDVDEYKRLGWEIDATAFNGDHRLEYGCIGVWNSDKEPPIPKGKG